MPVPETLYSAEQIKIPTDFPELLKNYTKHIIRTQPNDIILESAQYFSTLPKNGGHHSQQRFTLSQLETLYNKLATNATSLVNKSVVETACEDAQINVDQITDLKTQGNWTEKVPWIQFWALALANSNDSLLSVLESAINILSDQGKTQTEPLLDVFRYLSDRDTQHFDKAQQDSIVRQILELGAQADRANVITVLRQEIT